MCGAGRVAMAVSADELTEIDQVLSVLGMDVHVVAELRRRFPRLSWTWCDAADVIETPFRSYARYDIHLLDSADHCSQITTDPARATGIVLARRKAVP
jgi:hypothetical protein